MVISYKSVEFLVHASKIKILEVRFAKISRGSMSPVPPRMIGHTTFRHLPLNFGGGKNHQKYLLFSNSSQAELHAENLRRHLPTFKAVVIMRQDAKLALPS